MAHPPDTNDEVVSVMVVVVSVALMKEEYVVSGGKINVVYR